MVEDHGDAAGPAPWGVALITSTEAGNFDFCTLVVTFFGREWLLGSESGVHQFFKMSSEGIFEKKCPVDNCVGGFGIGGLTVAGGLLRAEQQG